MNPKEMAEPTKLPRGAVYTRAMGTVGASMYTYTTDQMRDYAAAEVAAERERWYAKCAGKRHEGCNYVATCGTVCNKCGQMA